MKTAQGVRNSDTSPSGGYDRFGVRVIERGEIDTQSFSELFYLSKMILNYSLVLPLKTAHGGNNIDTQRFLELFCLAKRLRHRSLELSLKTAQGVRNSDTSPSGGYDRFGARVMERGEIDTQCFSELFCLSKMILDYSLELSLKTADGGNPSAFGKPNHRRGRVGKSVMEWKKIATD